jgi:hypothetical protein
MTIHKESRIAQRAYEIWEQSGRPHGLDREHWFQATMEVEETVLVNGDEPPAASPSSIVNGDAPVHGPAPVVAKPRKPTAPAATTAPARTKSGAKPATTAAKTKATAKPRKGM